MPLRLLRRLALRDTPARSHRIASFTGFLAAALQQPHHAMRHRLWGLPMVAGFMRQSIAHVALVVRDYDEAIAFFTGVLKFTLVEDTYIPEQDKRWVLVAPPGSTGTSILLARPSNSTQETFVGNQTGGRVTFFLETDDFQRDYESMRAAGVEFVRPPSEAAYGTVAVFKDLYGNLWDLIQRRK